jgi:NAD+ synthase
MAEANTRSRMRMTTLYYFAGITRSLVVGTGNKIEDFGVGFFTKYGDGGVDVSPIADLTKSEVFALAKHVGVNEDMVFLVTKERMSNKWELPIRSWNGPWPFAKKKSVK